MRSWLTYVGIALFLCPCEVQAKTVELIYDHSKGLLTCGDPNKACAVSLARGDVVRLTVCNSLPGVLEMQATSVTRADNILDEKDRKRLGLESTPGAAITPAVRAAAAKTPTEVKARWAKLRAKLNAVIAIVSHPERYGEWEGAVSELAGERQGLVDDLAILDPSPKAVVAALEAQLAGDFSQLGMTADDMTTFLGNVDRLLQTPRPACYPSDDFVIAGDENLSVTFRSANDLVTAAPKPVGPFAMLLKNSWTVGTTTGIAVSGLADEHWTTLTNIVTPAIGTTPAVTKKVAKLESKDKFTPEAAILINILPRGDRSTWIPGVTVGGGISTGLTGRLYLGLAYPLGGAGTVSLGVAGGKVKRLSMSIDPNNPGDADPEATRRDVTTASWFFGIGFRVP